MSGRDAEEDRVKKYHLLLTVRIPVVIKCLITAAVERERRKEDVNGGHHSSIKPILLMIWRGDGPRRRSQYM